jgi:RNA polymerase sigma factor (sigma-70 family)
MPPDKDLSQPNELTALVTQAQAGDLEAFERLVDRFQDMAVGYAYSILNDFGLAEDAAQDAFIQLYSDLPKLREPAAFLNWFRRIVFKYCDRQLRGRQADVVAWDISLVVASDEAGPAQIAEDREVNAAIRIALNALPETERTVITLYYVQDTSLKDMASFLESSVATVDHRLRLARRHLSEKLMDMLQKDLQGNRPSRDEHFVTRVKDSLTRIPNRLGLENRIQAEIRRSRSGHAGFGLVVFDIDAFASVNQEWGHVAGDCLVEAVARQIQQLIQPHDFVARLSGEEFTVVPRRSSKKEVRALAEHVLVAIANTEYHLFDLLSPDARYAETDSPLPPSPANEFFYEALNQLRTGRATEAVNALTKALQLDREHVPSQMELEYLKLRDQLEAEPERRNVAIRLTVSAGCVWLRDGDSPTSMLERAQNGLARGKQGGRDQIVEDA